MDSRGEEDDEVPSNVVQDTLPRELRDQLDREHDGMEDVRIQRGGAQHVFRRMGY